MDCMIRELYVKIVLEGKEGEWIRKKREDEVNSLLCTAEKEMEQQEYKKCRDYVFLASRAAEERGFAQGMKYAMRLFAECMPEDIV